MRVDLPESADHIRVEEKMDKVYIVVSIFNSDEELEKEVQLAGGSEA